MEAGVYVLREQAQRRILKHRGGETMPFPQSERVVFTSNPLAEVVCQLTFPRMLELDQDIPVEFQKAIRSAFPVASSSAGVEFEFTTESGGPPVGQRVRPTYSFASDGTGLTVTLCSNFVALTATKYVRWEQFRDALALVLRALLTNYEVPFFQRIGLRYIDVIDRAALGIETVPWSELLRGELLGLSAAEEVSSSEVTELSSTSVLKTPSGSVRVTSGFARRSDTGNLGFLIDSDFFAERRVEAKPNECLDLLDEYNKSAGHLFRWCITQRLRDALKPSPISS